MIRRNMDRAYNSDGQPSVSLHSRTQTPHHHVSFHASAGTTHLEDSMTTLLDRQYEFLYRNQSKQDRQCTYHVTMAHFRANIVAVEKQ